MPRRIPTGLGHAAGAVGQSKPRRPVGDDGASALNLGSLGLLRAIAALTSDGNASGGMPIGSVLPPFSLLPRTTWHEASVP